MPFINLIEEQRISLKLEQRKARTALIACSLVGVFTVLGCGMLWLESEGLDSAIVKLEQDAAKVEPLMNEIQLANDGLAKMGPKMETLENAHEMTGKWNRILNHLTVQTPKELWLTGIRATGADVTKPIDVTFVGVGSELNKIGEYILRLQGCEELENVNLKFTQEKLVAKGMGIEFEITSGIAGTGEEAPKNEDEAAKEGK